MNDQHLSDEAVAACADGVLTGLARDRAARHIARCPECAQAVSEQREAAWVLRAAPAPSLPTDLVDRLRTVPQTTPIAPSPIAIGPDGSAVLSTMGQMAAFVPPSPQGGSRRTRTIVTTAAAVAIAGALTAGSVARGLGDSTQPGRGTTAPPAARGGSTGGGARGAHVLTGRAGDPGLPVHVFSHLGR